MPTAISPPPLPLPFQTRKPSKPTAVKNQCKCTSNSSSEFSSTEQPPPRRQRAPPGVDTRIHWSDPDEGWIGGKSSNEPETHKSSDDVFGGRFADLLKNSSTSSHYQFLGVTADADMEEIKAAYRRLSKGVPPRHDVPPTQGGLCQVHAAQGGLRRAEQRGEPEVLRLDAGPGGGQPKRQHR
ncbi:hypothetical protein QJS10_CPA02g00726 [Acorus calamus]|uniref:J domain-containing protein n=1 Tax=Acorus calamus TaxID=4465 RepID=A0AAV9FD76_ACOCL|nr:hypothetical protein QJS10_CPA02g00726 [Acorus calamus]